MRDAQRLPLMAMAGMSGFLAVAFGAFGAHGLEGHTDPAALKGYETGALYHLVHSAVLVGLAALAPRPLIRTAAWTLLTGIVLFSGSLYILGITGSRALVLVTPLGGLTLLAGWLILAYAGWRSRTD